MFRSKQRDVVYPQAEHMRLAGIVAAAWGGRRPPIPFESLVRGVATHDRGYGELDDDPLGEIPQERWLEIQQRGFAPQDDDPIVDLVVAMHIHRLVTGSPDPVEPEVRDRFTDAMPDRLEAAGIDADAAAAADDVTNLCDRLAFSFCFEQAASGTVGGIAFTVAADGTATLSPWPLAVDELRETVVGYEAAGYPDELVPVEREFVLRPA
jgi:hypothetical protein